MAHVVVWIFDVLWYVAWTAALIGIFTLAVITVVHGLHSAGRQH